jgi:SAM-dependent methyltransferase
MSDSRVLRARAIVPDSRWPWGHAYSVAMREDAASPALARGVRAKNRRFYDELWSSARWIAPERLNTWPLISTLLPAARRRLEVAPGLRPRLPLAGTQFADVSRPALLELARRGAAAVQSDISSLPFADRSFDLVCACDVIEHVADDERALAELCRVTAAGGRLLISVPLHAARWTVFDDMVGHQRRYEPDALRALLARYDLSVERSAVYGMQPRSSWLLEWGMWWLTHHQRMAMSWYNRLFMPLGVWLQKPLALAPGMIEMHNVDEILLLCTAWHRAME